MICCSVCGKTKDVQEFPLRLGKPEARCKECRSEYAKDYYKRNKTKLQKQCKEYYIAHREHYSYLRKQYNLRNRDKINKYNKVVYKLKKYSLLYYHKHKEKPSN